MPSASRAGLLDQFSRHLDAELAVNASQRDEAYRLRYDVYCEERGYEDAARFPNRMEMDEYDHNSIHALVRHRSSDLVAGVVRLVFADESDPHKPLPIEYYCGDHFDRSVLERYDFSRAEVAEVSRFAVSNRFVNSAAPAGDLSPQGDVHGRHRFQDDPSQYLPHISLGLIAMLFVASAQHRISHWYAIMEPSLNRLLGRSGIEFNAIGPIMNYHGRRQPMIASVNELLSDIYEKRYEFFRLIEHLGGVPADFTPDRRVAQAGPSRRLFSVS
jgi:N-acyl amino acid synthase of PEP-CTERM/exosortase system